MDLTNKVAIVTGSGRGLGLAYAQALAAAGAAVVVNDVAEDVAEAAAKTITAAGGRAVAHTVAVGTEDAASGLVQRAITEFGRLDAVVTNAGILRDKVLWNMSAEDFDAVIAVHLRGTFLCAREAVRHFREAKEGGRLILAGSPAGQRGNFGQTNYAAAKAGIAAMTRTWAMECAKANVTVNAIIPNAATAMTETIPFLAPYVKDLKAGNPIPSVVRRAASFGTAEDVAAARAVVEALDEVWRNNGRWNRFFMVPGGHIHRSTTCHTLHATTQISWLPDLSGESETEAVAAHGSVLCTHCFPSAPVEWTTKAPKAVDPSLCAGSNNYVPGANLRLRSPRGTCPECGRTVSVSSRGNARKHEPK